MNSPFLIIINFRTLISQIPEKLNLPPAVYGCVIEDDFYKSYVEIKPFPGDEDWVAYWGSAKTLVRAKKQQLEQQ